MGDTEVTVAEIRTALQNLDPNAQAAAARDPKGLSQLVHAYLAQRLVLKEALEKKWDENPAVTAALARLRDNAIAQTYLQSVSAPPASYPTDAQIETVYEANKQKFLVPRQYDLAQIFINDPKGAPADVAEKAQVKLEEVKKALAKHGADFAAVASAESDDAASGAKGGEIGWVTASQIQPSIVAKFGTLTKGSVSPAVQLEDGWHFLKVIDVKEPFTPTVEQVRGQIVQAMRTKRMQANSAQYVTKLMQDNPVQVDELALPKVLKP